MLCMHAVNILNNLIHINEFEGSEVVIMNIFSIFHNINNNNRHIHLKFFNANFKYFFV